MIEKITPINITFLRPIKSDNLPEKGLAIAEDRVNNTNINPFLSAPPSPVMKSFNSGIIKLKLVMNKNIDQQIIQKFLL